MLLLPSISLVVALKLQFPYKSCTGCLRGEVLLWVHSAHPPIPGWCMMIDSPLFFEVRLMRFVMANEQPIPRRVLWDHTYRTSAKFSGFSTPSPPWPHLVRHSIAVTNHYSIERLFTANNTFGKFLYANMYEYVLLLLTVQCPFSFSIFALMV